jgi:hypothetical protein
MSTDTATERNISAKKVFSPTREISISLTDPKTPLIQKIIAAPICAAAAIVCFVIWIVVFPAALVVRRLCGSLPNDKAEASPDEL